MELERIKQTLQEFANHCVIVVHTVLNSEVGINDKVGINTLGGGNSELYNNIEAISTEDIGVINLLIPEYAVLYVDGNGFEWARRPVTVKKDQKFPPPHVIAEWAGRKGLPTDNNSVYLMCRSIWEFGIKARPFINPSLDEIEREFDRWADRLFNDLCSGLDEFFAQ